MSNEKNYGFETNMIHAGYHGDDATHAVAPPLYQTNAYYFDNVEHAKNLFELSQAGNIYSRLMNPTNGFLEERIATLEGGVGALAFSSGHAAMFNVFVNLCQAGDEIVSSSDIYGGAINMMNVSLRRLGINVKFVNPDDMTAWESAITDKTRLLFTELIGNPNANISDIEKIAEISHRHGIPFMVDGTFNTPYLCKPLEHGADIVVHSATKMLSGHGHVMAGIVVCGGFDYKNNPRFPLFNEPDISYHGVVFADLGKMAFILRLRALIMRDYGSCLAPFNAWMVLLGVETLALRMERACENALKAAKFLETHPEIENVNYPALESNKYYELHKKYLPKGCANIFTFNIKGDRDRAARFMDALELIQNVANLGDIRTQVVHPATTTHSQLSKDALEAAGVKEGTIRISVGLETITDIIGDLEQALVNN
ncbi:MAG: O-acetylhomoserine aminocarboxypropyltransferase/cysteine synthase [Oscillospiraceae bacterium]|jgi:O-acetylhomoserine (thiol)-lyase|nr:O-acetylhomoserine aminocarboxypropyltransferase/cysteine synthase [Oscillospiraceae bacterium]